MFEIGSGIILALIFLLMIPLMLRGIAALFVLVPALLFALFLFGTSFGQSMLPAVVMCGGICLAMFAAERCLRYREREKIKKVGLNIPGR